MGILSRLTESTEHTIQVRKPWAVHGVFGGVLGYKPLDLPLRIPSQMTPDELLSTFCAARKDMNPCRKL